MKTLIIDNFDSFTYNLYQSVGELKGNPVIYKNNGINLEKIAQLKPTHIIISPGPGTVENRQDFGICRDVILKFGTSTPLLGVCLGHQGIIHAFGGKIEHAPKIMHGKQSLIEHDNSNLFKNVTNPFTAMRYHSLCGSSKDFPHDLTVTARVRDEKTIMGTQHVKFPIFGIQFHPESFGTPEGKKILKNFLQSQLISKPSPA